MALARGGRYLAVLGGAQSLRAWLDGAPLAERRSLRPRRPRRSGRCRWTLAAGRHVLLVKVARGGGRVGLVVTLVRAGRRAERRHLRAAAGRPAAARAARPLPGRGGRRPRAGARRSSRAARRWPGCWRRATCSAPTSRRPRRSSRRRWRASRAPRPCWPPAAWPTPLDGSLDEQIGRGRAEAALRAALAADPGEGEARLALADLLRRSDRAVDAAELLAAAPGPLLRAGPALALRARVALERNLPEQAEALAEAARADGGSCEALRLLTEQAARRDAVKREEELVRALAAGCRGGRDRLVRLLEQRGDAAGALGLLEPVVRARPAAVGPAMQRAGALAVGGRHAEAAAALAPLLEIWPRSTMVLKAAADQQELAGNRAAARALRERALTVDGSDLGLRRALALEGGAEPLADVAVDAAAVLRAYRAEAPREAAGSALVLDAAAAELHPGGAVTERIHQIIRVLSQEAVDQYGEAPVPAGAQLLTLRTLKPDGRVLEPEGGDGKESTSLSGLEPGDAVEIEFLQSTRAPGPRLGPAADRFYFETPGASMYLSTYLARAPAGLGLEVDAHGMAPPALERRGGWDAGPGGAAPRAAAGAGAGRPARPGGDPLRPGRAPGRGPAACRSWWPTRWPTAPRPPWSSGPWPPRCGPRPAPAGRRRWRAPPTPASASSWWGRAARSPRTPAWSCRAGAAAGWRCSKGLLDVLGVPARLAVVRPPSGDQTAYRFPRPGLWSGQLLRVALPDRVLWLDPSIRQMPFGGLPEPLLDAEALILPAPGEAPEVVRTPAAPAVAEGRELEIEVRLAADGSATVSGTDRYRGALGAAVKAAFERMNGPARRQAVEQFLARTLRGLTVRELTLEGEEDAEAAFTLRWSGAAPALARAADGGLELDALQPQLRLGARFVQLAARRTPLLVGERERTVVRLVVIPPAGLAPPAGAARRSGSRRPTVDSPEVNRWRAGPGAGRTGWSWSGGGWRRRPTRPSPPSAGRWTRWRPGRWCCAPEARYSPGRARRRRDRLPRGRVDGGRSAGGPGCGRPLRPPPGDPSRSRGFRARAAARERHARCKSPWRGLPRRLQIAPAPPLDGHRPNRPAGSLGVRPLQAVPPPSGPGRTPLSIAARGTRTG